MSTLNINAEIESTEELFTYTGAELQKPLEDLRDHWLATAKRLTAQIGKDAAKEPLPTLQGLVSKSPDNEVRHKIKLAESTAFEALLWAAEAKRTPSAVWKLRMPRLKWLFSYLAP